MEVFEPLSAFFLTINDDVKIGVTHVSLYMALLQKWNINKGKNPILINRNEIMKAAKINARYTYNKCINDLNNYGYIKYIPSSNPVSGSTVYIRILPMDKF